MPSRKILLYSTLNPFPFWAGSENLWFDFVMDKRVNTAIQFSCMLADSPVTRKKSEVLSATGINVSLYKHFNVSFKKRNLYKIKDKISSNSFRTLPWYNQISKDKYDLVWFNVAELGDLRDLAYPVGICKKLGIPYWLILQHGFEDFFLTSREDIEVVADIASSAKKFIFIADRNRVSLERAIGMKLKNTFHSVNAIPDSKIREAAELSKKQLPSSEGTARFFNLGRFSPRDKAQHLLLESLADIKWNSRDWQLSFIGVSSFGEYFLRKLTDYFGIDQQRVKTQPFTDNVFETIIQNDVLVMPSIAEGTPFAMIESMACCRPALGTPIGGIPELIIDNHTGWLSRTIAVADLTDKFEEVWGDRDKWAQYGYNAQQLVQENYSQESSFALLLNALIADTA